MDKSLEQRIQHLEDLEAIKKLQATYGHFVDQGWNGKVFQDVSNFFTDDATFECAAFNLNAKATRQFQIHLNKVLLLRLHSTVSKTRLLMWMATKQQANGFCGLV